MGCDLIVCRYAKGSQKFQSTHPSGVRRLRQFQHKRLHVISIHAPQWGATSCPTRGRRAACDFNPRTPVGCDWRKTGRTRYSRIFQSTHPSGVRPVVSSDGTLSRYFNPRTPVGCDSQRLPKRCTKRTFQSTHPSGVRLLSLSRRRISEQFQSTHPSGVRLAPALGTRANPVISIHAPQWGATGLLFVGHARPLISIHAPQWGATGIELPRKPQRKQFQSTHPSGVRRWVGLRLRCALYFNPRTPVGCDESNPHATRQRILFQSTHPSGVRPFHHPARLAGMHISIHAPQWGATRKENRITLVITISIHAPQWGATQDYINKYGQEIISIHAPQWGATSHSNCRT